MEQQLFGMVPLAIALLLGVVGGAIFARLVLKRRIQTATIEAKSDSQLEIARLTERVSSVNSEVARQQAQIGDLQAKLAESVRQLDASKAQCAQLAERASRIPSLESQVSSLQTRVQEEGVRASSLAEQAARVPELQQSQQNALLEIQQLNKQLADLREKWGASESKAEVQRKAIERSEAEKSNTFTRVLGSVQLTRDAVPGCDTSGTDSPNSPSDSAACLATGFAVADMVAFLLSLCLFRRSSNASISSRSISGVGLFVVKASL